MNVQVGLEEDYCWYSVDLDEKGLLLSINSVDLGERGMYKYYGLGRDERVKL